MKNTGKRYEALTEQVFTRLLQQGKVCAQVERDVVLAGKSTNHQIDVTFEFVAGPTTYRTIVQCKDWASPVKQEQVLAFHAVLNDIPGQPRGIMVARSGFQEGARHVAEHHGIKLYELREPRDEDWEGLIRTVVTQIVIRMPHFDSVRLVPDDEILRQEAKERNLSRVEVEFSGHPGEIPILYESGEACDLDHILNSYVPKAGDGPYRVHHGFDQPVFAEIPGSPIPRVAMSAMEATIHFTEHREEMRVNLDHMIAYSFRDVIDSSVEFLRADGEPVRRTQGKEQDDIDSGEGDR